MSLENFILFNNEINNDTCLEVEASRMSDKNAKEIVKNITKCETIEEFQKMDRNERKPIIRRLREEGLSIRQISRLTGISKGLIERA